MLCAHFHPIGDMNDMLEWHRRQDASNDLVVDEDVTVPVMGWPRHPLLSSLFTPSDMLE